jgi:hypothetical protein
MKSYRVVIVVPPGYQHSLCFAEVAMLLKNSLISCGYSCDIVVNDFSKDRVNIVLGYHLLEPDPGLKAFNFIVYQLEQLSSADTAFAQKAKQILLYAKDVWDYSPENIAFLAGLGISAKHVPVGYHKSLEQISVGQNKDVDVLFFGSKGDRRQKILSDIYSANKCTVKALFGLYGQERAAWIARSKIVLNIHYYSAQIFEAVRVSYLVNNQCCVVSESSAVYPYPGVSIPLVGYEDIAQTCFEILDKNEWQEKGRICYEEFKEKYGMVEILKNIVDQ